MRKIIEIILVLFISYNIIIGQEFEFIHEIDNGELEFEFSSKVFDQNGFIYLFSTGRISQVRSTKKVRKLTFDGNDIELFFQEEISNNQIDVQIDDGLFVDGEFYFTGLTTNGAGLDPIDMLVSKYSIGQNFENFKFGKADSFDRGYGISLDGDKNIISCGRSAIAPNSNVIETYVIKQDNTGELLWEKLIPSFYKARLDAFDLTIDEKNNIYVFGRENAILPAINELSITKLSPDGDLEWQKQYPEASFPDDAFFNTNGNLIASMYADFDGSGSKFSLVEFDTKGEILWNRSFNDELGIELNHPEFRQLENGNYALAFISENHPVIVITDKLGEILYFEQFQEYITNDLVDFAELQDNSIVLTGNIFNSQEMIPKTMWIAKTKPIDLLINTDDYTPSEESFIFPNPSGSLLFINNSSHDKSLIINNIGQVVGRYKNQDKINISKYPSGTYTIILYTGSQKKILRFVKI